MSRTATHRQRNDVFFIGLLFLWVLGKRMGIPLLNSMCNRVRLFPLSVLEMRQTHAQTRNTASAACAKTNMLCFLTSSDVKPNIPNMLQGCQFLCQCITCATHILSSKYQWQRLAPKRVQASKDGICQTRDMQPEMCFNGALRRVHH